jgi:integrase
MLKTCIVTRSGPNATPPADMFRNRRDEAILRFMIETGARAGEVVAITLDDMSILEGRVTIRRGRKLRDMRESMKDPETLAQLGLDPDVQEYAKFNASCRCRMVEITLRYLRDHLGTPSRRVVWDQA